MLYLIYERDSGRVVGNIEADETPIVMDHHATIEAETIPDFQTVMVVDGALIDNVTSDYLDSRKRKLSRAIDDARDAALAAGAPTPHGSFQADDTSRINIAGAVNMAITQSDFSMMWKLADNSFTTLSAEQMIAVGQAVGAFTSAVYQRSFVLKAQLQSLDTIAKLDNFSIDFATV